MREAEFKQDTVCKFAGYDETQFFTVGSLIDVDEIHKSGFTFVYYDGDEFECDEQPGDVLKFTDENESVVQKSSADHEPVSINKYKGDASKVQSLSRNHLLLL